MPTLLPIVDRPLRIAVVGLGQIAELCLPPYATRDDVEVVALCDLDAARVDRWRAVFPGAAMTQDIDTALLANPDVVDVLVPTPHHGAVANARLERGISRPNPEAARSKPRRG